MKRSIELSMVVFMALVLLGSAKSTSAQQSEPGPPIDVSAPVQSTSTPPHALSAPGTLFIPPSSTPQATPAGHKFAAHTNVEIFAPSGLNPDEAPPFAGYGFETPASIACHLHLVTASDYPNCNPNSDTIDPTGGSNTIAIVDAYDDPSAPGDLAWFSLQFGIPLTVSQFQVVWANPSTSSCPTPTYGVPIDPTGGWELEESLDIEWAHAMAPGAKIYLVEACSNFDSDLILAVRVANNLVQCGNTEINPTTGVLGTCPGGSTGKGEVSMSWGAGEFVGENGSTGCALPDDSCFTTPGIVYFASIGDGPGVIWPGTSPNVVSAGGTTMRRNSATFALITEAAWPNAGGGHSAIEARPAYQSSVSIAGSFRLAPDISFDANPFTGVYVMTPFPSRAFRSCQWVIVGGTSVSAPSLAWHCEHGQHARWLVRRFVQR